MYSEAQIPGVNSQQDIIFSMGLALKTIRNYTADDWQPLKCYFIFPEPEDISAYHANFGTNLTFDYSANKFEFESSLLDTPTDSADTRLIPILLQQANQTMDDIRDDQDPVKKLRLLFVTSLGSGTINATRLNYSETSAFDRLFKRLTGLTPRQYRKKAVPGR